MPKSESSPKPRRRDALTNRRLLIRTALDLLIECKGPQFTLVELGQRAGLGTATVYRHFSDMDELLAGLNEFVLGDLIEAISGGMPDGTATERLHHACVAWVDRINTWGRASAHVRESEGILSRLHADDPFAVRLANALRPVIEDLAAASLIPRQDFDIAFLLWVTTFDERVVNDLRDCCHLPTHEVAALLEGTVLASWRSVGASG
ncbi:MULTISPECIES: TetR/AcrR family transcriptional regulator [unclassified Streptomyces]|uniref:TetR/AcrR family transcriptional regulator n=1 Tax=unclassified Streptomyces TaxID=2593676 RepID=UPI0035DBAE9A